jgi:hypothetical protein
MSIAKAVDNIKKTVHHDIHCAGNPHYSRYKYETEFIAASLMSEEDRTVTEEQFELALADIKTKLEVADAAIAAVLSA